MWEIEEVRGLNEWTTALKIGVICILAVVYSDLAAYLNAYSFPGNTWLDAYFMEYTPP